MYVYIYNIIRICCLEMRCNLIIFRAMLSVRLILRRCNKKKIISRLFWLFHFSGFFYFFYLSSVYLACIRYIFDWSFFFWNAPFSIINFKLAHAYAHNHQNIFHIHFEQVTYRPCQTIRLQLSSFFINTQIKYTMAGDSLYK